MSAAMVIGPSVAIAPQSGALSANFFDYSNHDVATSGAGLLDWANNGALTSPATTGSTWSRAGTQGVFNGGVYNGSTQPPTPPSLTPAASSLLADGTIGSAAFMADPLSSDSWTCNGPSGPVSVKGDPTTFTGAGSEKNNGQLNTFTYGISGNTPPKDEITNVYAISHNAASSHEIFFGGERVVNNGDSHIDFEFLQAPLSIPNPCGAGTMSGHRTQRDLLLSTDFSNGGTLADVTLYSWSCNGKAPGQAGYDASKDFTICDPAASGTPGSNDPQYVAVNMAGIASFGVNSSAITCGGWVCRNSSGVGTNTLLANTFMEGGIDLAAAGFTGCFNTFLPHTRSAQTFTATLKDFAGPISFTNCKTPTVTTSQAAGASTGANITAGVPASVTDTATLHGAASSVKGSVTYKLFSDSNCTTEVGSPSTKTINGTTDNNGDIVLPTSDPISVTTAGKYYWTASYSGDTSQGGQNNEATSVCGDEVLTAVAPSLSITKTADAATVSAGDNIGFTITATNNGQGAANDTTITDALPAGSGVSWSISPAYAGPGTCAITGSAPTQTLSCAVGTLASGASASVHVTSATVRASCGVYPNSATVSASNNGTVPPATASTTVQCPTLSITKTADSSSVSAGSNIGFTITVSNSSAPGTGTAKAVTISDPLPTGTGISWSISPAYAGPGTCSITSGTLNCSFGDLAPGASATVHITSPTVFASCATYPNTASAQATNNPKVTANASTSVQCPGLQITKTADNATVSAGDNIGFTVTVSNSGPGTATGVTLSDPLPAGSGVSWSISPAYSGPGTCSITSGTLNCMFGDMASGASASVHVTSATVNASCGVYPNTATASATNDGSQQASASTTVQCPSLAITKTADNATVSAGSNIGFTIGVSNAGPGVAKSVTLSDPLPTGNGISWSISPAYAGPGTCSITSGTLNCSFGDMAAGAAASVHVTSVTTADSCATYPNTASAQATNNPKVQASASTQVLCPSLQITKTAGASSVSAGDNISFTISVTNTGAGTATATTLSDPLPGGSGVSWSINPAFGGPGTCSIAGSAPNQTLNCSFGDLASGASATVHISSATARVSCGTYPNTATAAATNNASVQASASTTVNCPNLAITKTADDSAVSAGSNIGFTIHVTNPGPGTAKAASLSDPLPTGTGINWSISPAYAGPGTCSIASNTLSCSFGDMAAGASATVHISSPTTASTPCADYPNTASAQATNNPVVQASATTTVQCPGLNITKTADAASVSAGTNIGFTIVVSNTGAGTATAATLSDPLPGGSGVSWSISPAYAGPGTCSITGGAPHQTLSCSFGDMGPGASASVHVTSATSFASCATYPNTATASATNTGSVQASASTTVNCPALTITKTADAASVSAGTNIGFTITVGNTGAGTATAVSLSDPLPAGNGISWSIDPAYAGPGTCSIASGTLNCSFGDMAQAASASVHVSSATSAQSCATYPNTASAQATNHAKVQASASTQVLCPALSITKTADAPTVSAGDAIGFTINVSNSGAPGTGVAKSVTLSDPLPTGAGISWSISPAYAGPGTCSITSNTLNCSFGDMTPGASISVHVSSSTTAQSCATYQNTASAQATNNAKVQASASTTVDCPALAITKTADASPVNTGDPIGFSITVSNSGASGTGTAKSVTLNDPLPAGSGVSWSISPAYAGPGTCSITGSAPTQTLSCSFGDMAPGASTSVHIASATTAASAGTYPNTATASASNTGSVHDSATIEVIPPNVTISKTADAATVSAGDNIGFTVIVGNSGPGIARSVTLNDPLPGGNGVSWSISPAYGGQGTCSVDGTAPSQTLSCSFGDMALGASASVHVTSATNAQSCADYPNQATASATNFGDVHANASTTVDCPGLHITKTADDASVSAGDAIGFTINVSNTGLGTARSVAINDPLPGGSGIDWSIDPAYSGQGTCSITGDAPAQTLSCSVGDLAAAGSASVHVTSPTEFASCATYPNQASATATNNAQVQASASTTVDCPSLSITKTADASPVNTGDDIGFTVTVANGGPGIARSATLDDPLPGGNGIDWSISPAYADQGTCSISGTAPTQTLDCAFGDLAANASVSVHILSNTTADSAGTYNNTATASADNAPTVDASASVVVDPPAIAITKTADDPQVDAGQAIGFTVTVSNADTEGTGTARAVTVSDPLPSGSGVSWSVSPDYSGPGTCSVTGSAPDQTLACALGDMAPGASASVHITSATTDASVGDYPNTATASATNTASVQASADTKVIAVVPVTVAGSTTTTSTTVPQTTTTTGTLPFTGSNGTGLATVGFLLLVAGGFLTLSWRRRRTARS